MKKVCNILLLIPTRTICEHLMSEKHTLIHRISIGTCIMIIGVVIATTAHSFSGVGAVSIDLIGYLIHGIGATPYVEGIKNLKEYLK